MNMRSAKLITRKQGQIRSLLPLQVLGRVTPKLDTGHPKAITDLRTLFPVLASQIQAIPQACSGLCGWVSFLMTLILTGILVPPPLFLLEGGRLHLTNRISISIVYRLTGIPPTSHSGPALVT